LIDGSEIRGVPFVDLARQHRLLAPELRGAFDRVLGSSGFILGEEVERFEAEFADYCGVRHCVGAASGTAALTIMLQAAGIGRGDEVIIPAHTFIATALAVVHAGAAPVCVDVERDTGLIDPEAVRAAIGPLTAAILPVHLYGQTCHMAPLRALADRTGLALLEDAAQAHGATYRSARAGSLGRAAAFSFYPSKNLGALGDGGAICTDDAELAAAARRLRDLGRDASPSHDIGGYNERLDGLQAALLRVKLRHLEDWNAVRRSIAAAYRQRLGDVVELLHERPGSPCVYHVFPIRVSGRDGVATDLAAAGIATGVHYPRSLADQPALPQLAGADVPVASSWAASELSLPIFPELTVLELELVATAVARRINPDVGVHRPGPPNWVDATVASRTVPGLRKTSQLSI
jgi:dTDP-4-amino-4,6-dideoxygalactose transaminase